MTDVRRAPRPFYAWSVACNAACTVQRPSRNKSRSLAGQSATDHRKKKHCPMPRLSRDDGRQRASGLDGLDGRLTDRGLGWIMWARLHTAMTLIHAVYLTSRHWHVLPSQWITAAPHRTGPDWPGAYRPAGLPASTRVILREKDGLRSAPKPAKTTDFRRQYGEITGYIAWFWNTM